MMDTIHPKTAAAVIAPLVWAVLLSAIQQYAPAYAPLPALATAVGALLSGVAAAYSGNNP